MKIDFNQAASSRERFLFVLVVLTILVLYFRVIFSSQSNQIDQLTTQREGLILEKDALLKFSATTPFIARGTTLSQKKGIKAKIILGEIKSSYKNIAEVLEQVVNPRFLSGVKIKSTKYDPPQADKGYARIDFKLKVQGLFVDVMRFLVRLEQFPALVNLEQLSFSLLPASSEEVEVEIQGRFFQIGEIKKDA